MPKSIVSIVKGTDVQKMVDKALSLLGGVESFIKPGSVVVIKPNAGHPAPPETSVNTNPAVIAAIIKAVRRGRPKEIILAEAGAVRQDTLKVFDVSGIGKAAEDAGIDRIVDIKRLSREELVDVKVPHSDQISSFRLPKLLLEADCVIGAPIFKTHLSMTFTGAVKAMKGTVDDKMHRRMHFVHLGQALFDLLAVSPLHLAIVDMIRPQEGLGPMTSGTPVDFGAIVAGTDPVAVDATCCRMVGIVPEETYLAIGAERGFGNIKKGRIEVRGNSIKDAFKKLDTPFLKGFANYPDYCMYDENACSSCMGIVVFAMEALKRTGKYEEHKGISIVFGPKKALPKDAARGKDLILVGNCVDKFRDEGVFVPGCPPMGSPIMWGITKREDQEEEQIPVDTWKEAEED
ncbi:MAG: DUF362 domain-containing protein [Deltaproteobacteria bacterium]|nr:DUF362 domain-containing protein [Deltaproteobacteria bacterium]